MGFKDRELSRKTEKNKFSVVAAMTGEKENPVIAERKSCVTFYIPDYLNRAVSLKCADDGLGKSGLVERVIGEYCTEYIDKAKNLCNGGAAINCGFKKLKISEDNSVRLVKVSYSLPMYANKALELKCAEQDIGKSACLCGMLDKALEDYIKKAKILCAE